MSKIRLDFVTNSSSSSYTCCVCGGTECGYEIGLYDCGMIECENGHTFCEEHLVGNSSLDELVRYLIDNEIESEEDTEEYRYELPAKYCPICSFGVIVPNDVIGYFLSKLNMTEREFLDELRSTFGNYKKFLKKYDK